MKISLVVIVAIALLAFAFTDVRSASLWRSGVLPLVTFGALTALGLWIVAWLFQRRLEGSEEWMPDAEDGPRVSPGSEIDLDRVDDSN